MADSVRLDSWLHAVRRFKTRSLAQDACRLGQVTVNDEPAKPAHKLGIGDRVSITRRDHEATLEVTELLSKRVGAKLAVCAYIDHSPPQPPPDSTAWRSRLPPPAVRDDGAGRPTKRDRRQIDKLRGRS